MMRRGRFFEKPVIPVTVLLGFNGTIATGNLHNALQQAQKEQKVPVIPKINDKSTEAEKLQYRAAEEACWNFLKGSCIDGGSHAAICGRENWKQLFVFLLKHDCQIAIISFTEHTFLIKRYLREILQLDENHINKILIYNKCPECPDLADKSEHINCALLGLNANPLTMPVLIVDHAEKNLQAGVRLGCQSIPAKANGSHVHDISQRFLSLAIPTRTKAASDVTYAEMAPKPGFYAKGSG